MSGNDSIAKLLKANGAVICPADAAHIACIAVEQNNMELLKRIAQHGGDVTQPKWNGTTALHAAVCEGNVEMVKFLVDQGADIDKQDASGWTPRALADQQGHDEIKSMFQKQGESTSTMPAIPTSMSDSVSNLGRFQSEPAMPCISQTSMPQLPLPPTREGMTWSGNDRRRRASNFHNSIFGMISAANRSKYMQFILEHIGVLNLNGFFSCGPKIENSNN